MVVILGVFSGVSRQLVEDVLTWAFRDSDDWSNGSSWRSVLLTPGAVVKHWDRLRQQMRRRQDDAPGYPAGYEPFPGDEASR